jgi:hypothetical protein
MLQNQAQGCLHAIVGRPVSQVIEGTARSASGLAPEDQDSSHDQVAEQLVTGIDREKLHGLFGENGSGKLHGGHEAEPDVKADQQTELEALHTHSVEEHWGIKAETRLAMNATK